jgi:hypothetical protein
MPSWQSERFWHPVHVMLWPSEERWSPAEGQLSSPCFRKGLRAAVVMEHAGRHHYLFYRGKPDGTPVLFPVA